MDVHATPAKAQRAQHHHHSRSGAAAASIGTDSDHGHKSTNRRRHDKSAPQHVQPQPAWGGAVVSDSGEAHFDYNGRFVSGPQDSSAPDESPAPVKGKKNRGKHAHNQNGGQTHPQPHMSATQAISTGSPAKAAYAGPTFHASPAASALPKPMFMSKSVPGDAKPVGLQSRLEQETGDSGSSATSTPDVADSKPASIVPPREESPLEVFFKADRAEKSKSQTPTGMATPSGKTNLAVEQSAPPGNSWSDIYQHNSGHHQRTESAQSQRGMFALELEGTGVRPARSPVHQAQAAHPATAPRPNSQADGDPIRRFLLETAIKSSPSPKASLQPPQHPSGYSSDQPGASPFYRPSPPTHRSSSGPSTPMPQPQPPNSNLHYGNRNLSPLFQAAKSPPNTANSQLRRELGPSPPQHPGPHQQWASIYQQQPGQYLTPPPDRSANNVGPPPPTAPPRSHSYDAQPASTSHDTKSMEDDLRRILKLTASRGGATGVQG